MDVVADLDAPCSAMELFSWVDDLTRYPEWLDIVAKASRIEGDAWAVDLRGRLGPLARSKRLRMVRPTFESPHKVVFERSELDGRQHSPWRLSTEVTAVGGRIGGGSHLRMELHYGGALFGSVLERVLRDEIEHSKQRLLALVSPD